MRQGRDMVVQVNGADVETQAGTIAALLDERGVDASRRGLAVALNGRLAPRHNWSVTMLQTGDEVEIVRPFTGG